MRTVKNCNFCSNVYNYYIAILHYFYAYCNILWNITTQRFLASTNCWASVEVGNPRSVQPFITAGVRWSKTSGEMQTLDELLCVDDDGTKPVLLADRTFDLTVTSSTHTHKKELTFSNLLKLKSAYIRLYSRNSYSKHSSNVINTLTVEFIWYELVFGWVHCTRPAQLRG